MGEIDLTTFKVSKKAFDKIIRTATANIEGISRKRGGFKGLIFEGSGINRVELSRQDDLFIIDIHLEMDYGTVAYKVAQTVQDSVAKAVTSMLKMKIKEINVFIDGVNLSN